MSRHMQLVQLEGRLHCGVVPKQPSAACPDAPGHLQANGRVPSQAHTGVHVAALL